MQAPAQVVRPKVSILDKSLSRGKQEVSLSAFALLFSELVQYCQARSTTVTDLQQKLHDLGWQVGSRLVDIVFVREGGWGASGSSRWSAGAAGAALAGSSLAVGSTPMWGFRRETKLLNVLLAVKSTLWKAVFGKEADKLEQANDDERTYYIIENDPLVNRFVSVPKDKGSLNCAAFAAGVIEAALEGANFPAKVTAHWHKGTTFMVKFEEHVIAREKLLE